MKIKKLEICGFKSFVDRTVVHFDHDVTGIVGPNGCGKSNIVDAIRWCMGEQSAKHLRGKSMEDVIFNGSELRGPHSFAEVTITFDNADGLAPAEYRDYAEIAVTRRLDRSGASDYAINKTPVRLLDVTELFLGTGVGTKAYSIIEQGRIGYIVSSKPEDRRHLIEEAAGITKFKAKKKAAERKMELTQQNLLRLADIVSEIERSLASLRRQAQKAERYKQYRAELRDHELHVAAHRLLELLVVQKVTRATLDDESATRDGMQMALRVRDAELEGERLTLLSAERIVEKAQSRAYEIDNAVKLLDSEISHALEKLAGLKDNETRGEADLAQLVAQRTALVAERNGLQQALVQLEEAERSEAETLANETEQLDLRRISADEAEAVVKNARARVAEAQTRIARAEAVLVGFEKRRTEARGRLDKLRAEREQLEARFSDVAQESEELRSRLEGLRGGKQTTADRKAQLETELQQLRAEIQDSEKNVERLRTLLAQKRSRLHSLEEIQKRFEGVGAGVRAVMQRFGGTDSKPSEHGILGLVADRIECSSELTQALAGVLGEKLQWVVVEKLEDAAGVLDYLHEAKKGRVTLVPRSPRRVVRPSPIAPSRAGVVGWLADLARADDADEGLVRTLLDGVLVVEDLATARALHEDGFAHTLVTRRGEVLGAEGRVTGGAGEELGAHMLDVKREVRELHGVVGKLDTEMTAVVARHGELRSGIASRQAELDAARTEAHDAEIAIVKAEKDLRRVDEDRERTRQRSETVAAEADDLAAQLAEAGDEESQALSEIEGARVAKRDGEDALAASEEMHALRRGDVERQAQVVTEVRVRAAQARQKAESDRNAIGRLDRSIGELDQREQSLRGNLAQWAREQGRLAGYVVTSRESLAETAAIAMDAHDTLTRARTEYDAARANMSQHETGLRELRQKIDAAGKRTAELTLRDRELSMDLGHLLDQTAERHRVDLRKILGDFHQRDIPDESVMERIADLLRLIERMGEINLTAIEEAAEQETRYAHYATNKKDLEDALADMEKTIRKLNIESKRMFRDTFHEVNERFKRVFPKMFGGGMAELKLTNPDDLLESGIEIYAQPPGKKLGSLELMSGGEKALTAVSLIFAIFQFKPSPFCLLDEVDAPLDEANIGRFSDAIRLMTGHSQFIVITHSKRTMETADVLYGVTMEQPGVSKLVAVELRKSEQKRAPKPADVAVA